MIGNADLLVVVKTKIIIILALNVVLAENAQNA
jgi:hypothetical protein